MTTNRLREPIFSAFERGVAWLSDNRSVGGGWGDERWRASTGVTGHVLLCLADLGMAESELFTNSLSFFSKEYERDDVYKLYWFEDRLRVYEEPEKVFSNSLLAVLPLLLYKEGLDCSRLTREDIENAILHWGQQIIDFPNTHGRTCEMWLFYQLARTLEALSYKGDLWTQLAEILQNQKHATEPSWGYNEPSVSKATAHVLSILLRMPDNQQALVRQIIDYLFNRASQSDEFAFWESDSSDPVRGPFFVTRWVITALIEASQMVPLSESQTQVLAKACNWLAWIQRTDGAWIEIKGNPLMEDNSRNSRRTGAGFVAYSVGALGKWLLMNGQSNQDIQSVIKNSFPPLGHIFISYKEADSNIALNIALGLEEAGYMTWSYELDSVTGVSYLINTKENIEKSIAFLVVISPRSIVGGQITREIVRAHENDKPFFPVLFGISHKEFQSRQPEWQEAMGAATSTSITPESANDTVNNIVAGLQAQGIDPRATPDITRIERIRKAL